ncbi:MAG TPA: NAD-dependent epimerase/dehydratase family protein [Acidobacteriota bacterium]|nr:NAD-dependent epimerase/dehydratase family protein [Acidobacteriota bacterium]HQF87510.1 NAD-dependent epimerase/dehydratase family protein [Acidobacteriota bacterium]HQG92702.1 NAD-dependent epimerase/dehydratase family protein [Acidobacteriota bacterium]
MGAVLVTGSGGLIGSQAVEFFAAQGYDVFGIDNDMRRYFFGSEASTAWRIEELCKSIRTYRHFALDIRDADGINALFRDADFELVIHTAAQPSHDWAAREPLTDFTINAHGTLVLLEATRQFRPESTFIYTSTNKVYGDAPNALPLVEQETRWELPPGHPFHDGIDESMSVDQSTHSLFGASKLAADVLAQEYGRYFGMKTAIFRGGCLTGPYHSGAELHGFLAYLAKCIATGKKYYIFGYKAKQVRDNIHSLDLVDAFWHFHQHPRCGEVYNIGGARFANVSMTEAIAKIEAVVGKKANVEYIDKNRIGDHIWYISNVDKFRSHYPGWNFTYDIDRTIREICDHGHFV